MRHFEIGRFYVLPELGGFPICVHSNKKIDFCMCIIQSSFILTHLIFTKSLRLSRSILKVLFSDKKIVHSDRLCDLPKVIQPQNEVLRMMWLDRDWFQGHWGQKNWCQEIAFTEWDLLYAKPSNHWRYRGEQSWIYSLRCSECYRGPQGQTALQRSWWNSENP